MEVCIYDRRVKKGINIFFKKGVFKGRGTNIFLRAKCAPHTEMLSYAPVKHKTSYLHNNKQ